MTTSIAANDMIVRMRNAEADLNVARETLIMVSDAGYPVDVVADYAAAFELAKAELRDITRTVVAAQRPTPVARVIARHPELCGSCFTFHPAGDCW